MKPHVDAASHTGPGCNGIGLKRSEDGALEAIVSDYDRRPYLQPWLNRLTQCYAYQVAKTKRE
jgi:hypothetical protein